ncbi:hypothetical protein AB0O91_00230 [Kitasatospora sp. NPDC089797]|uniref:hypothetical protein n=1 Tax=Kitasatospora sp. NPDC089797 TaxID=3155298 RepID=UPI00341C4798
MAALPETVHALWKACVVIAGADGRARALTEAGGPRTWPGYARALAAGAHHDDDAVRDLLKPLLDDPGVGEEAWTALRAWTACVERSHLALAAYQALAPAPDTTAAVSRACDTVEKDPDVYATSNDLDRAVRSPERYLREHPALWSLVRTAWSAARRQGMDAGQALDVTLTTARKTWSSARVRDVTALPSPARVPAGDFPTPSAWANALLQLWWTQTATDWCGRLEKALTPGAVGSRERVLLLVRDWPLTRPGDEEIAYLSQFPQTGPTVPDDLAADPYDHYQRGPRYAVVLSVPRYAADQAVDHTRRQHGRITTSTTSTTDDSGSDTGSGPAALTLLRTAYPYLPEHAADDGPSPEPSAVVRAARALERSARNAEEQLHWSDTRRDDSRSRWTSAFTDGLWTWVPDDTGDGPALQQLPALLEHCYDWMVMRLHVESGPAGATAVHTLFGHPQGWDARRAVLRLRPVNGHRAIAVARHRIVGLSGVRHRRGGGRTPLWEDYQSPNPQPGW